MSNQLINKRCIPCEGGAEKLSKEQATALLKQLPTWNINDAYSIITKRFEFSGFYKVMAFVNTIAWIAHQENHHPTLEISYNYCVVSYTTHAIGGLSENDFICAAKIEALI